MAANQTKDPPSQAADYPPQIIRRPRCPECHSVDVARYASRGNTRYYKCRVCPQGTTFKVIVE